MFALFSVSLSWLPILFRGMKGWTRIPPDFSCFFLHSIQFNSTTALAFLFQIIYWFKYLFWFYCFKWLVWLHSFNQMFWLKFHLIVLIVLFQRFCFDISMSNNCFDFTTASNNYNCSDLSTSNHCSDYTISNTYIFFLLTLFPYCSKYVMTFSLTKCWDTTKSISGWPLMVPDPSLLPRIPRKLLLLSSSFKENTYLEGLFHHI